MVTNNKWNGNIFDRHYSHYKRKNQRPRKSYSRPIMWWNKQVEKAQNQYKKYS